MAQYLIIFENYKFIVIDRFTREVLGVHEERYEAQAQMSDLYTSYRKRIAFN